MNMEKQQEQRKEEVEKEQRQQFNPYKNENNDNNAYSLFLYGVRSPITRGYYLRRLRIFFNFIKLLPDETMEKRCDCFAIEARRDPNWVFNCIIKFLQFQRERVERKEIVNSDKNENGKH